MILFIQILSGLLHERPSIKSGKDGEAVLSCRSIASLQQLTDPMFKLFHCRTPHLCGNVPCMPENPVLGFCTQSFVVCYDEISPNFPCHCASTTRCPNRSRSLRPLREIPSACTLAARRFTTTRTSETSAHSCSSTSYAAG